MKKIILSILLPLFGLLSFPLVAQAVYETRIDFEDDEYWWGGVVVFGSKMPYLQPVAAFDLALRNEGNQTVPLFLSNKGRYVWSDLPFTFEINGRALHIKSPYEKVAVQQGGKTLKEVYLHASAKHFPPSGTIPDRLFFSVPQYNTWIELMYNQNQHDIMRYAQSVVDNGFPAGVLTIDDNWQKYYGNFDFKPDKFPDPKGMIARLHDLGFKVMLWVCPFVSADSPEFRFLAGQGYLLKAKGSDAPAIIPWWNGFSACYDFTNPAAVDHFIAQLKAVQAAYGVDGFKFDGGNSKSYDTGVVDSYQKDALPPDHTMAWAAIGLQFPFNEYRACWKMGGQALVQRLNDKDYSWDALQLLIPDMLAAGLMGHAYTCPDMIGGGEFSSFLGIDSTQFDQELIVRSAQVHALMSMMQFSIAPWRILNDENLNIVRHAARLHQEMGDYILSCAEKSAVTGEPIVQHLEYAFPQEGFAGCNDQLMLGDKFLVAPAITPEKTRAVKLPKGKWKDEQGKTYRGGRTVTFETPLSRLLYFEKL
jgi:alpha-glucosidase